jgi:hypothetical protein
MRASKYEALVNQRRDALINFQCVHPNAVNIGVITDGVNIYHGTFERHVDVVTLMEQKYMFFGDQADIARQKIAKKACPATSMCISGSHSKV